MGKIAGLVLMFVGFVVLIAFVVALPFMWIWNYAVVSAVTVAKPISYWVAFWLMVFFSVFFAGSHSSSSSK